MNFSAWAIRNPVPPILFFVILTLLGIWAFRALPITQFPNIDVPIITVTVTQAGAAPSELTTQVTERVENAVAGITGVKHTTSVASEGVSTTTIEFQLETNSDRALNDVKDALARIRSDLPAQVNEPIIQRLDIAGLPIMTYAVSDPTRSVEALSWFVDDTLSRELQSIRGVGKVERIGGADREIRVKLDPDRLSALGVTAAQVSQQIGQVNADLGGGRSTIAGQEQSIRTLGSAATVEKLAETTISLPGGRSVRLDQIGTIRDSAAEARSYARLDGRPIVGFAISRASGASDADVAEAVRAKVETLRGAFPGIAFNEIDNSVDRTIGSYDSAMHTLVEGAILAVIVVFLFLKDWRATLIAAVALPLSVLPAFFTMHLLGFSLNLVSLLGVTLVTGILVDDAIVEIENIVRHMRMGKSAWRASLEAADEIGLAVIAISFTIIAVFAPVSFMGGIAGQYFRQFGLTVAFAVFFSLLVARLITPMMTAYLMRSAGVEHEERDGWIMRSYVWLVRGSLRFRWITLMAGFGVFALSLYSATLLPSGFLPTEDQARSIMIVELPPGATLDDTRALTDRVTRMIAARPEVKSVFVKGGSAPNGATEVRKATFTINFTPRDERERTQTQLQAILAEMLRVEPDIRVSFAQDNGQRDFSLVLVGDDGDLVAETARKLAADLRQVSMLANVTTSAALDRPEIQITPIDDRVAELGISTQAISQTIRVATIGDVDQSLAKFNAGDRQIPIRVELEAAARREIDTLSNLKVTTQSGAVVPLVSVARIGFGRGPTTIERYDRQRRVAVEADLVNEVPLGPALEAAMASPTAKALPPGVKIQSGGDAEVMNDVFTSFGQAIGGGVMMVYAILVLLFGSFLIPVAILLSLPLSVGGAILALYLTNKAISLPVVIGILMLMGIVTKNAIMLIDFALISEARGMSKRDAIVDAGHKRARPIVMTTIAMVAGMIPSAMAIGQGGEFRAPMAIAVIGGLIVSTFLSLLFVPSFYSIVDTIGRAIWWVFGRFLGQAETELPVAHGHGTALVPSLVVMPEPRDPFEPSAGPLLALVPLESDRFAALPAPESFSEAREEQPSLPFGPPPREAAEGPPRDTPETYPLRAAE